MPKENANILTECQGAKPTRLLDFYAWVPLVLAPFCLVALVKIPNIPAPNLVVFAFVIFYFFRTISVLVHEMAHAGAHIFFGHGPVTVQLGRGKRLLRIPARKLVFELCQFMDCGITYPNSESSTTRLKEIISISAGPTAEIIFLLGLVLLCLKFPFESLASGSQMQVIFWIVAAGLAWNFSSSIKTNRCSINGETFQSDLALLMPLLTTPPKVAEAWKRIYAATEPQNGWPPKCPFSFSDFQILARHLGFCWGERWDSWRDFCGTAWLIYQIPGCEHQIDKISKRLFNNSPGEITRRGTRGSVLVQLGNFVDGCKMLEQTLAETSSDLDRQFASGFLAVAQKKLGDSDKARKYYDLFKNLNPPEALANRIKSKFCP